MYAHARPAIHAEADSSLEPSVSAAIMVNVNFRMVSVLQSIEVQHKFLVIYNVKGK